MYCTLAPSLHRESTDSLIYTFLLQYCIYCTSAPSLHRESTDSLIYIYIHFFGLFCFFHGFFFIFVMYVCMSSVHLLGLILGLLYLMQLQKRVVLYFLMSTPPIYLFLYSTVTFLRNFVNNFTYCVIGQNWPVASWRDIKFFFIPSFIHLCGYHGTSQCS